MATRPPADVFRPCLPFDPFPGVEPGPWKPSISPHADPPTAVLVLGDSEQADLHPILFSQSLLNSLVVIVTHAPPYISQTPLPAVRILRLATSLAQDLSALRLVGLLERAGRVVRRFRANAAESSRKLVQLAENSNTGEFDVEEAYSAAESPSPSRMRPGEGQDVIPRYPSPAPSATSTLSSSASSVRSSASSTISRRKRASVSNSRPPTDRAFDAIINFLPSSLPDKFLIKHAILVSTLSASFVAAPPAPRPSLLSTSVTSKQQTFDAHLPHSAKENKSRRFSALLRRPSTTNPAPFLHSVPDFHDNKGKSRSQLRLTTCTRKPHLVHVLPSHVYSSKKLRQQKAKPKPKLVQSVEQFLLAFGYPLQSMSLLPSSASHSSLGSKRISMVSTMSTSTFGFGIDGSGEKPIPFLLPAGVLGSAPVGGRLSVGEIILMGGFDNSGSGISTENMVGEDGMVETGMEEGRVWIGSPDDVVWDYELESLSTSSACNPSAFSSPLLRDSTLPAPSPTHPRSRPTRSSSMPIPSPGESTTLPSSSPSSAPIKPPLPPSSVQLTPSKSKRSSFPITTPSLSPSPLSPPAPTHILNAKPTKRNVLSKAKFKRSSTTSSPLPSEATAPKELKQKQLPTPPESASSLEDGNDDDDDDNGDDEDDKMTSETTIAETGSLPSVVIDHHHLSSRYQQQHQQGQGKVHYVKAASTLGHGLGRGRAGTEGSGGSGKNLKGFMARFGFGLGFGKLRVLKVSERN